MTRRTHLCLAVASILVAMLAASASDAAAQSPAVVFMEPAPGAGVRTDSIYREVTDSAKLAEYRGWLNNESARFALRLYAEAVAVARAERHLDQQPDAYYVAVVPDGNDAWVGFQLESAAGTRTFPHAAYILLAPDDWHFTTTLLHETGHMLLYILAGGNVVPRRKLIPIEHSTAALTDRGTAFDEGFAIHLETVMAQTGTESWFANQYRHAQMLFGAQPGFRGEYYRPSVDLLTFSQTVGRYALVRDNHFAFEPAYRGPDYFRVQLDPSRDFAALRSPDALLQSEGFYASVFYSLVMRGKGIPDSATIGLREHQTLVALADLFGGEAVTPDTPYLLRFLASFVRRFPGDAPAIDDVFLDLTHGVFVDPEAEAVWSAQYAASIRVDLAGLGRDSLDARRTRWREILSTRPDIAYSRLGPQLRCEVAGVRVRMLGEEAPLSFDANTVPPGVLRLVPGLTEAGIAGWLKERASRPFASSGDLAARVASVRRLGARMRCESRTQ